MASDRLRLDVAILGGGLAGSLLARQLSRTLPGLRIGVFEKSTEPSFKVGEATVEIAANYFIRRLGLSGYFYDRHLPKNGLRFFFDDPDKSTELPAMSEVGSVALPYHPAFQINRARLEGDLHQMNAADGVLVRTGARVEEIELNDGGLHRFVVDGDGGRTRCESRWVVDASGRAGLIARLRGLRVPEPGHPIAAVWGRFEKVTDLDDFGPPSFRARVRGSSRMLSTVHFCYPGYWIWFIPLRNGITSVGVVGERSCLDTYHRTETGFLDFLRRHRAVASLLEHATLVDVGSFAHLPYGTTQFFSSERWGLVGEAGAFADPYYSPGSDYIALENDYVTDLIQRDVADEAPTTLAERTALYDQAMLFRHEAVMRLYRGLYSLLGSYELCKLKWDFDIVSYYNLWVTPYMQDQHLDAAFLRRQLREQQYVLQALANFADLFKKLEATLRARGQFYRKNLGEFAQPLEMITDVRAIGMPRPREEMLETLATAFNAIRNRALDLLEGADAPVSRPALPLASFMMQRSLV